MSLKNIYKIVIIIIVLHKPEMHFAQSMSLADPVVAGEKTALFTSVTAMLVAKGLQIDYIKRVKDAEKKLFDKRGLASNFKSSPTVLYTIYLLQDTQDLIDNCNQEIALIKAIPKVLRHGLSGFESDLAKEQKYLNEIKNDHNEMNLLLGGFVSGGTGYNKAADIKIMIRTMEINARLKLLENKIKNLRTLNRVIYKLR